MSEARQFWLKLKKAEMRGGRGIRNVVCTEEPEYLGACGEQEFYEKVHVREVVVGVDQELTKVSLRYSDAEALFQKLRHGDDAHQKWLRTEINKFFGVLE